MTEIVPDYEIVWLPDSGELDRKVADLYKLGLNKYEISARLNLGTGSVTRRLTKMFRAGEILPIGSFHRRRRG